MARSRNIKPGFFTNDELAELPALTRLLFVGLWTLVDRDGRIEDRPKKIKAECMPYDDMDADAALSALCKAGFILRERLKEATVIVVSHQASTIEKFCKTAAVLRHGQLYMFDSLEEAKRLYEYENQR